MFTTNIQLGTPGQTLPVLLDLNWNDLFVPSSDCRTYFCFGRPKYNATSSSTHSTNGTRTDIRFWIMGTRGVKSADTIHLGSLSIHDFIFEEALTIGGEMWPDENAPLSVLGLSRVSYDTTWSNLSSLNPFQRAVTDKALTRPLFSLQLPKSEQDVGELLFGSVNPKHTHGITAVLPISDVVINHNIANESVNGGWHVQAQHARYGDDIFSDLSGRTAVYTTLFKELGLPHELAEIMQAKIGDNLLEVPCARRHELPDFVIRLGSDDETFDFVLTPEDYIRDNPSSGLGCRTIFVDIEEENNDNLILLGSYFIDCFYHVFNAGNMTISRKLIQALFRDSIDALQ